MRVKSMALLAALCMFAACAVGAGEDDSADGEAAESTTSTVRTPATTSTTAAIPALPPELEPKYPVVMTEGVSGPDIDSMIVWAPDAEGEWPMVLLLAGWDGIARYYSLMGEMLAGQGMVVFAPDYRAQDIDTNWRNTYRDAECAYRHMRAVAAEYGGDIGQPVTVAGHSTGAVVGVSLTLDEFGFGPDGPFDACPVSDVPRPDRFVGLGGCYSESGIDDRTFDWDPVAFGWTHFDADVHLVVGSEDAVCEAHQTEHAATVLADAGFENVDLTLIEGANHFDTIFKRWEGTRWFDLDTKWFDLPNNPNGVAAVQAMLETVEQPPPLFKGSDHYVSVARAYCEAWPTVGSLLTDDAHFAEVPPAGLPDGLVTPEGVFWTPGLSTDITDGIAETAGAVLKLDSHVQCGDSVAVSGDWVAMPFTSVGPLLTPPVIQGIWLLRVVGGEVQWHLSYGSIVGEGEDFGPVDDPVIAAEAREFCSIVEGSGYVRSASELLGSMTEDPAVFNIPEGLYWPGVTNVESMVQYYPPELEIGCGDDVVTSGDWSAQPIFENAPIISLSQVGMWVYHHQNGKIHRQFAHNTRISGQGWGLPLED